VVVCWCVCYDVVEGAEFMELMLSWLLGCVTGLMLFVVDGWVVVGCV